MIRVVLPVLILALVASSASAQDDPYAACAAMADDGARLTCFDTTHARVTTRAAEEQAQFEEQRLEGFGLDQTRREQLDSIDEGAITGTVVEAFTDGSRRQVLLLDNGQLWRERSGTTLRIRVRQGWTGEILRHWSGAYEMRFEGRTGYVRLERLR